MEKEPSKLEMEVRESEIAQGVGESMFQICSIEGQKKGNMSDQEPGSALSGTFTVGLQV